jgi:hypothetical protein
MKKLNVALLFLLPLTPVAAIYLPKWDGSGVPVVYKAPAVYKTTVVTLPTDPKKKIEFVADNEDTRVDILMQSAVPKILNNTLKASTYGLFGLPPVVWTLS